MKLTSPSQARSLLANTPRLPKPSKPTTPFPPRHFTTSPTKMTHYPILVTSDIVCPWCYIGHTRLSRAMAAHKEKHPADTFHLQYLPFYLNPPPQLQAADAPAFPVKSVNKRDYYAAKFGAERGRQIEDRIVAAAAADGLHFSFGGNTGVSRNGHRLVYYGQTHGGEEGQNNVMLGLWRRYYEREVDITQLEVLVEVGVESGLGSADEIRSYLESGRDGETVDKLAEEQRMNGVSGVPNYVLMDTWEVSGAQEPEVFLQLFQRWKDLEAKGQVKSGADEAAKGNGVGACL